MTRPSAGEKLRKVKVDAYPTTFCKRILISDHGAASETMISPRCTSRSSKQANVKSNAGDEDLDRSDNKGLREG
jgi:hypothetical protein